MDKKIGYWLEMAEYDFATAIAMLETQRYLYVGFMLHQTIEKILKGYYVSHIDDKPPYTHSLIKLAQDALIYNEFSDEQKNLLDLLDPLNIEARYPTHKERLLKDLNATRCGDLISETEEMFTWIKAKL